MGDPGYVDVPVDGEESFARWCRRPDSNLYSLAGRNGMRRSTSVAGYPHRIPKTTYFGLNRPMAEVDHEERISEWNRD
jgi:hypothetical protein